MSERLQSHETGHEHLETDKHESGNHQNEINKADIERKQHDLLEASRDSAEVHATPANLLAIEKDKPKSGHDIATHNAIKRDSYKSLLKHTQNQLPKLSKQFSRIIHQKNIESISNITSQTVARPSGLLGGGLGALAGSITLLYYSKHYGFRYNYAFFLVTFLCGFMVGLLIELFLKLFKRHS